MYRLALALLLAVPCWGQTTTTGKAETSGPCSPAVTGSNNQFTISCQGITKEQGEEFSRILNTIAKRQLDPKLVMDKLDEIEKAVKKVNTLVWAGYDFNGTKREQSPGVSIALGGDEISVFSRLNQLYVSKDWNSLQGLAENQIQKTPDWPTPYFFAGLAEMQLGDRDRAADRLKAFLSGADNRLDYQQAVNATRQILSQLAKQ